MAGRLREELTDLTTEDAKRYFELSLKRQNDEAEREAIEGVIQKDYPALVTAVHGIRRFTERNEGEFAAYWAAQGALLTANFLKTVGEEQALEQAVRPTRLPQPKQYSLRGSTSAKIGSVAFRIRPVF